jgi:hypothetical protein
MRVQSSPSENLPAEGHAQPHDNLVTSCHARIQGCPSEKLPAEGHAQPQDDFVTPFHAQVQGCPSEKLPAEGDDQPLDNFVTLRRARRRPAKSYTTDVSCASSAIPCSSTMGTDDPSCSAVDQRSAHVDTTSEKGKQDKRQGMKTCRKQPKNRPKKAKDIYTFTSPSSQSSHSD